MDVFEAIRKRREITHFSEKQIAASDLEKILDSAFFSPTGNNLPSREFILVKEKEKLTYLSHSTPFVSWLAKAQAAIVVTGCPDISKYWLQDASIACAFIWLSATELEIGVGFGAVYNNANPEEAEKREEYVRKALDIPEDRRIVAILGLGYPEKWPPSKKMHLREDIVHYERFGVSK